MYAKAGIIRLRLRDASATVDTVLDVPAPSRASRIVAPPLPQEIGVAELDVRPHSLWERACSRRRPDRHHRITCHKQKRQPHGLPLCSSLINQSSQARKQFLGFVLLPCIPLVHHLIEDIPRPIGIAHVDVGLGQVELGGDFVGAGKEVEFRLVIG